MKKIVHYLLVLSILVLVFQLIPVDLPQKLVKTAYATTWSACSDWNDVKMEGTPSGGIR